MNCRRFQNELYEYLDGALSPETRAAAEQHLSECVACREKLKEERQVAQAMGGRFRRAPELLELPPAVGTRVLAALANESPEAAEEKASVFSWHRLAWPLALAASMLLLLGLWVTLPRVAGPGDLRAQRGAAGGEVSVQLSYVVPAYTFRLERGFVIDALSYHTNVVNERLPAHPTRLE
jgi:anti-sigma factor RsiW